LAIRVLGLDGTFSVAGLRWFVKDLWSFVMPPGVEKDKENGKDSEVDDSSGSEFLPRAVLCREEKIILIFFEEGSRQLKLF